MLASFGVEEVVMTTGYYDKVLVDYCNALHLPLKYTFVNNPLYDKTNYIYSIYCAKDALKDDDIILMHGDLVFESRVMEAVIDNENSCMAVSSTLPLPEKDFKAVIKDGRIKKVGIEFFDNAMAAQPLYKIKKEDFREITGLDYKDHMKLVGHEIDASYKLVENKPVLVRFRIADTSADNKK